MEFELVLAAAKVWHWWIGLILVAGAVLSVVATLVGYLVKVTATKYPRD